MMPFNFLNMWRREHLFQQEAKSLLHEVSANHNHNHGGLYFQNKFCQTINHLSLLKEKMAIFVSN